ncbi:MAG: MBOAT family O-acyltransferase [Eubacteriales bacterium]|nr:MBOAT family O-acyltransferase [Eubacteriales bacterium]
MVFSSITFLCVFLPITFVLHWILPGIRTKNILLIIASLLFYAYGEPVYVLLMLASVLLNYIFGLTVNNKGRKRKWALILAVIVNIGLLVVFKYAGFLVELVNSTGWVTLPAVQIALPIGISFFTFQALSYVIDVYRGNANPQKNPGKVLLYISFFPQLIAGPIVKYHDIEEQIGGRRLTAENAALGMRRFIAGLSKKVLISNVMGLTVDTLFAAAPENINILSAWIAAVSYLLQIYFDFSGYSDMALGLGRMFGFEFKENFCYPYVSCSITEFWRRWHISLSGWFREYLYFPLGGNRKGLVRTIINKWIVFACTGIWHGANLTFLCWGLYHGFFMMVEEFLPKRRKIGSVGRFFGHLYALLVVTVGFVIFRADTLAQGFFFVSRMFTGFEFSAPGLSLAVQQLTPLWIAVFIAACIAASPVKVHLEKKRGYRTAAWLCSIAGLVLCMLSLSGSTYNPFIYFRF